ncbi:MFS transporter [Streptomyces lateritius]|uniref:MFS transporter n=1 Tax=Streptomyces lateritius TaxID=67313 RepID=UPI001C8CC987|nr:MFS transporter [Streptomyces lateritius]MBX9422378.1 MFS transporter [Streptomyces lateritius]
MGVPGRGGAALRTVGTADGGRPSGATLGVAVACLGFFLIMLDSTVVNVAAPVIGADVGGGISGMQWVVNAYVLVFAASLLSSGAVSDRIGAVRALGCGLALFGAASVACAAAPSLSWLVAARAAQGLGAALILPSSLALIRQSADDAASRARRITLWAMSGGVAVSAGPVVGGVLTSGLGWQAVFWINVPLCALGLALGRTPASEPRPAPLDLPGQAAAVVGLASLTYAIVEDGPLSRWALLVFGLAAAGFVLAEIRAPHPVVPPALVRSPAALTAVGTGFVMNASFFGIVFVFTLYFQQLKAHGPLVTGLMFVPLTALTLVGNLVAGRLMTRLGTWRILTLSQAVEALGCLALLLAGPGAPPALVLLFFLPIGLGAGATSPPMTNALLDAVDPAHAGAAGGLLGVMRQVGGLLGVAVFGAVVAGLGVTSGTRLALALCLTMLAVSSALALVQARRHPVKRPEGEG